MSRIVLGVICGLVFGVIDAALMLPLPFPDKTAALAAAFASRFGIGFVIATVRLSLPAWASGMLLGALLSLPDAIITKAYAPILISGIVGGAIIGWVVAKWGRD